MCSSGGEIGCDEIFLRNKRCRIRIYKKRVFSEQIGTVLAHDISKIKFRFRRDLHGPINYSTREPDSQDLKEVGK
jgi:hypothetical protein